MFRYIGMRILGLIGVVLVISLITFLLMHTTPGGPWDSGKFPLTGPARDNMLHLYGLDKPLVEQYLIYIRNAAKLDFGIPYTAPEETVLEVFGRTWPISLQLAGYTMLIYFPLGIGLGILSAVKRGTWIDYVVTVVSLIGILIPSFVLAYAFIMIFGVALNLLPIMGWNDSREWLIPGVINKTWIMPVTIWGMSIMAGLARYTRTAVIEVMSSDYVRTARAKGLPERLVLWRHIMRNAMLPIIAVAIPMIPGIITGNSWLEKIFGIPGIGRYFLDSVLNRDYVMIMAVMLTWSFLLSLFNLIADLMYGLVDPRVRLTGRQSK
jgi:ABC-type dipeptide/oligopeptide/nickel transport system permease component